MIIKRTLLACVIFISATANATPITTTTTTAITTPTVTTAPIIKGTNYLSPYCGCCKEWITHMKDNGFELESVYQENLTPTKIKLGVLPEYASCHTAQIEGYTFEGHIPAADIKRFLASKPTRMKGLAVGGMPMGSPGMEYGDKKDSYNVIAFDEKGRTMVWASHN